MHEVLAASVDPWTADQRYAGRRRETQALAWINSFARDASGQRLKRPLEVVRCAGGNDLRRTAAYQDLVGVYQANSYEVIGHLLLELKAFRQLGDGQPGTRGAAPIMHLSLADKKSR